MIDCIGNDDLVLRFTNREERVIRVCVLRIVLIGHKGDYNEVNNLKVFIVYGYLVLCNFYSDNRTEEIDVI